jgi:hypothetical protein
LRKKSPSLLVVVLIVLICFGIAVLISNSRHAEIPSATDSGPVTRIGPPGIYPDPARTPGATDPDITQSNIDENICNPNWSTRSIRPPVHYTDVLKREQIIQYGYQDASPKDYEEDHLIPLELGGNPTDERNLWPEPYFASIPDGGAHAKDRVESYLHRQVCSGEISLAGAQHLISSDWYRVYIEMPER